MPNGEAYVQDGEACVSVVDDDELVLRSLARLLKSGGFAVRTFPSSEKFLEQRPAGPGCLVLDMAMPGLNGLELQARVASSGDPCPVVFLSGESDVPTSVQAMKGGAVDFLTKPVIREKLLESVRAALAKDAAGRAERERSDSLTSRLAKLTPREYEVLNLVAEGLLNKQIAAQLGTAEKTVKVHRARAMRKMEVGSVAELVRRMAKLA
jgi:FixJ family two-component response regulator